jgi:hypothetical protein
MAKLDTDANVSISTSQKGKERNKQRKEKACAIIKFLKNGQRTNGFRETVKRNPYREPQGEMEKNLESKYI